MMVRRSTLYSAIAAVSIGALVVTISLFGQSRDAYEQAYRDWRSSDPNLERDAGKAGSALASRTDQAAAAARKFSIARKAFYDAQQSIFADKLKVMQPLELPKDSEGAKTAEASLTGQEASIANSIQVFGNDPDKGIQQLRVALEKERLALAALQGAIKDREKATESVSQANENADRARSVAADEIKGISASFTQSSQAVSELADAWPSYYRTVADGARGVGSTEPPPPVTPPIRTSTLTSNASPNSGVAANAGTPGSPAPVASNRVVPAVPISRYTGSWSFLPGISTYHGLVPISYDLTVREEGGQFVGTVTARFIVNGNADPDVRFDFSGPMQAQRFQVFPLKTAEGAKGTVELIPGNAFNLIEVNYTLDGAPGKVREADVILVKR